MLRLETQIAIDAPAEKVWSLLLDFPSYASWNPFIRSVEGKPIVGQSLKVLIQPPGGKGMIVRPMILAATPDREFRWKGKILFPGIFDGEHYFRLESQPQGGIIFHHGEIFSGLLVPLLKSFLENRTKQGFVAMNEALKRLAEKS
jgi:hypothetical protein